MGLGGDGDVVWGGDGGLGGSLFKEFAYLGEDFALETVVVKRF